MQRSSRALAGRTIRSRHVSPLARLGERTLRVPKELDEALGEPGWLRLEEPTDGSFLRLRRTTLIETAYRALRSAVRILLGRGRFVRAQTLRRAGSETNDDVVFSLRRAVRVDDDTFGIANHNPYYDLVPYRGASEADALRHIWSRVEGYEAHLPSEAQGAVAHARTEWLVQTVLARIDGSSFLEIGCGGGRNLAAIARERPDAVLHGFDPNAEAVAAARQALPEARGTIEQGTVAEVLPRYGDRSVDVTLSFGVLMMLPNEEAVSTLRHLHRIARRAVVLFELAGPSHDFDFWAYPRDYAALVRELGLSGAVDEITIPQGHPIGGETLPHSVVTIRLP